jgi:hypothetical protein
MSKKKLVGTPMEREQFRKLRVKGYDTDTIRGMMKTKFTPQRWAAFVKDYQENFGRFHNPPSAAMARVEQLARCQLVQQLALETHERVMEGTVRKTVSTPKGTTEIMEEEIPNTRSLDSVLKAVDLESQILGTKAIQESRIIMQDFREATNALVSALTRHLLPDHEGLYNRIMADIEKETAKVPGL